MVDKSTRFTYFSALDKNIGLHFLNIILYSTLDTRTF